jgi:hypothetical protein
VEAQMTVALAPHQWIDLASAQRKRYERSIEDEVELTHGSSWADKVAALELIEKKRKCSPG